MNLHSTNRKKFSAGVGSALCLVLACSCGQEFDVGSDILWTSRFEGDNFNEWTSPGITGVGGGSAAFPSPNTIEVSKDRARGGIYAAKLTVTTPGGGSQATTNLLLDGTSLPTQAYYSAWYYVPQSISVGIFWVIMKFRIRTVVDDSTTEAELFDIDLKSLPSGEMSIHLYDHRIGTDLPLAVKTDPVVPVGEWFQIEAFYRNANDATGGIALWFNGRQILDGVGKATSKNAWMAWDVGSIGQNLTPQTAVLFVDDCAISRTRIGPTGLLSN